MSEELLDEHKKLLNQVAKDEGFEDYTIKVESGGLKGDNYMGIIKLVIIEEKNSNKKLNIVFKLAHSGKKFREAAPIHVTYERESHMYSKLLPELVAFQNERNVRNVFNNFPKMYGSYLNDEIECIALENLNTKGFKMWNRKVAMDHDHVALIMKTFGKYHAASMAFKKFHPDKFEELTTLIEDSPFRDIILDDINGWLAASHAQCDDAISTLADNEKAVEGLKKFKEILPNFLFIKLNEKSNRLVVIHGDPWCNNMLFKYEDKENPSKPTEINIIDWQMSMISTPVRDLTYFFVSSTGKEILDNVDTYINIYYQALSENLKELGCDIEEIFPRTLLDEHWKDYAKFGLYIGVALLNVILEDSEEAQDLEKNIEEGKSFLTSFNSNVKHSEMYKNKLNEIVMFFVDRDLI